MLLPYLASYCAPAATSQQSNTITRESQGRRRNFFILDIRHVRAAISGTVPNVHRKSSAQRSRARVDDKTLLLETRFYWTVKVMLTACCEPPLFAAFTETV